MKIEIIEENWGPSALLDSKNGKKCCLGFACLAIAPYHDETTIVDVEMPNDIGVYDFEICPSKELLVLYNEAREEALKLAAPGTRVQFRDLEELTPNGFSLKDEIPISVLAATANDSYHEFYDYPSIQTKCLLVMKKAFEEAGHEFILVTKE